MSTQLKLRRGTTAQHSTFTGAEGEVTVDTTKDTLVVHDGTTAGGHPLLRENNPSYTGSLTGGTGVVNLGSGQLVKDASGNVGIGTSSPTFGSGSGLEIQRAGVATLRLENSNAGNNFELYSDSVANGINLRGYNNAPMVFWTNNTERARITAAGDLLAGTTTQDSGAKFTLNHAGQVGQVYVNTGTGSAGVVYFRNGNGVVGQISTSGSSTSYVTSSDYRLKEDIAPMTGALAFVRKQRPVTYKWKSDGSEGSGYIAHWMQEDGAGNCVTGEKDAVDAEGNPQYQGIDTSFMVAPLNAALNELADLVESLTAKVQALEARLALDGPSSAEPTPEQGGV